MTLWDVEVYTGVQFGELSLSETMTNVFIGSDKDRNCGHVIHAGCPTTRKAIGCILVNDLFFICDLGIDCVGTVKLSKDNYYQWGQWRMTPHGQTDPAAQRPATSEASKEVGAGGTVPPQRTIH